MIRIAFGVFILFCMSSFLLLWANYKSIQYVFCEKSISFMSAERLASASEIKPKRHSLNRSSHSEDVQITYADLGLRFPYGKKSLGLTFWFRNTSAEVRTLAVSVFLSNGVTTHHSQMIRMLCNQPQCLVEGDTAHIVLDGSNQSSMHVYFDYSLVQNPSLNMTAQITIDETDEILVFETLTRAAIRSNCILGGGHGYRAM